MRGQPGHSTQPHAWLPPSFLGKDAWMISQLHAALIRKLRHGLICLTYSFALLSIGVCTTCHCQTSGRLLLELNACTVVLENWIFKYLRENKYSTDIKFLHQSTCQCQVVQRPMDSMSKNEPRTSMTHVACELKLPHLWGHQCMNVQSWQSGVRSCISPWLSAHLVHCTITKKCVSHSITALNDLIYSTCSRFPK